MNAPQCALACVVHDNTDIKMPNSSSRFPPVLVVGASYRPPLPPFPLRPRIRVVGGITSSRDAVAAVDDVEHLHLRSSRLGRPIKVCKHNAGASRVLVRLLRLFFLSGGVLNGCVDEIEFVAGSRLARLYSKIDHGFSQNGCQNRQR